jgi:hypothetical protein
MIKIARTLPVLALLATTSASIAQAPPEPQQPPVLNRELKARVPASIDQPQPSPPIPILYGQPDAQRTRGEFQQLLDRYPPAVRAVLQSDSGLFQNATWLTSYPALADFLKSHPEIARNPSFYVGAPFFPGGYNRNMAEVWRDVLQGFEVLLGFAMFFSLLAWIVRTVMDHRRWNRQNKVQTDVHTKLLDRLTGNEDLLAYIQSPAGSKFLESSPIRLDSPSQSAGAPLGRIVWTVQGGVVVAAAGAGLLIVSAGFTGDIGTPLHALGILGLALGAGFIISAIISFLIARRLGLVEIPERENTTSRM